MRRLLALAGAAALALALGGCGGNDREPAPKPPRSTGQSTGFVPSLPASRGVVWAVGDGADGSPKAKALAARIAAERPDRLLYLGDVYQSGTAQEFATRYRPVYGALDALTAPTPGNHEWPRRGQGYDPYWRRARGSTPPPYYSFRAGGWQLISLNSELPHDAGSQQVRWLSSVVRAPGTCRLAFWHRPRFSAGSHGDQPDMAPVWNALRGRATMVLSGHDHDMQRLAPVDGITQFVSGAGGESSYAINRSDPRLAFGNAGINAALRLELTPGLVRYAFITTAGATLDTGSLPCRG